MSVNRAQSDQDQWLKQEVLPHEPALRAYLHSRFPDVRDVDDIVQDSYLRLLEMRKQHEIVSPKAYLYATARNAALSQLRRPRIFSDEPVTDLTWSHVLETSPDTAAVVNQQQEIALLMSAIDTLPPRCREIFILRKLQGLPQKEIAARLGISEQTVQVQIARGAAKCAAYFRVRGITER